MSDQLNGLYAKSTAQYNSSPINSSDKIDQIVLWKSPIRTLLYFVLECCHQLSNLWSRVIRTRKHFFALCFTGIILLALDNFTGPHSELFNTVKAKGIWWSWWVWLGFLSSCGFGTGLHTFVLYLGPFIASVTMSAYECNSLQFPSPPYPDDIVCPDEENGLSSLPSTTEAITFFKIVRKVELESFLWGIGTAIGELPPYFMAQTARLSGQHLEELEVLEEELDDSGSPVAAVIGANTAASARAQVNGSSGDSLSSQQYNHHQHLNLHQRGELLLHRIVKHAGFLGILLCASIPNPLFDFAGMTCGHFLVPFWSFFGATCIGKAVIKVHLQMFLIIAISSEHHIDWLVDWLSRLPIIGTYVQAPVQQFLQNQKVKLHSKHAPANPSWLQTILSYFILALIATFVISIINAMAKAYFQRSTRPSSSSASRGDATNKNGVGAKLD